MSFHIALMLSLLALVAGMYLLAKTRAENLGKLFGFASWLVISVSSIALAGQLICAVWMFACHVHGEHSGYSMHSGFHDDEDRCESKGHCGDMNHCCEMRGHEGRGECCHGEEGKGRCGEEEEGHGMGKGCGMDAEKDSSRTK